MNAHYAQYLAPAEKWIPLLEQGVVRINPAANRVVWTDTSRFAGALQPVVGEGVAERLAGLPLQPQQAIEAVQNSAELAQLAPALQHLQLVTSVGALASVASLGVSCVGFALVLHRLRRIEGKLDQMLGEIAVLKSAVAAIHSHATALSLARLRAAGECLERALAADSSSVRRELAVQSRALFQETKALYLQIWIQSQPWYAPEVPIPSAMEMQARYVAAAIGEIQAEFVIGDAGAFRRLIGDTVSDIRTHMQIDAVAALRARSDAACVGGPDALGRFQAQLASLGAGLRTARGSTDFTAQRLDGLSADLDTARQLGLEPFEMARLVRSVPRGGVFLLGSPESVAAIARS